MSHYADAGVNIDAATSAKRQMAAAVRSTHGPDVLAGMGAFGGCLDAGMLQHLDQPVLVASTDGVGTKTLVAAAMQRYDTIGQDLVNHCINDILVQGARPLFFLDYVAAARLDPAQVVAVVAGVAAACRAAGCTLLGGETAEMPGVYQPHAFDLAGTMVGVVERAALLPHTGLAPGDALLALPSTGLHTNGYSLARRLVETHAGPQGYQARPTALGGATIGEALLAVHRSYLPEVHALQQTGGLKALAHITGGGLWDNLPRVLPARVGAIVRRRRWPIPPIFDLLVAWGQLEEREAFHVFNMGLGMLAVIAPAQADAALAAVPDACLVGELTAGDGVHLAE